MLGYTQAWQRLQADYVNCWLVLDTYYSQCWKSSSFPLFLIPECMYFTHFSIACICIVRKYNDIYAARMSEAHLKVSINSSHSIFLFEPQKP